VSEQRVMIPAPKPLSTKDLLSGPALREFLIIIGKDSVGKTCSVVSICWYIEQTSPNATCFVIDTENKFKGALKSFGKDAPNNISYYKCDTMNMVTDAIEEIVAKAKAGDWVMVESMDRVWEKAQDMGYQAIAGTDKAAYMEKRRASKGLKLPATPQPDQLWGIIKGAHDGAFLDLLSQSETLNVVLTTTLAKPPKADGFMKENQDRKAARVELGIDSGIQGAPRLPYYPETLCLLDLKGGNVSARILRDNLSINDDSRIEFDIPDRKSFAMEFWSRCR
jgi:hypothetical protein